MQSVLNTVFTAFTQDSEDLMELAIQSTKEYHAGYIAEHQYWWDQLSEDDRNGLIKDRILNYDDDERDLIWWCGRLSFAKQLDESLAELDTNLAYHKASDHGKANPELAQAYCDGAQQAVNMAFFGG